MTFDNDGATPEPAEDAHALGAVARGHGPAVRWIDEHADVGAGAGEPSPRTHSSAKCSAPPNRSTSTASSAADQR